MLLVVTPSFAEQSFSKQYERNYNIFYLGRAEFIVLSAPSSVGDRVDPARPIAATMIGLMAPLVGRYRLARWLRVASFALVAIRLARNWRDRPR